MYSVFEMYMIWHVYMWKWHVSCLICSFFTAACLLNDYLTCSLIISLAQEISPFRESQLSLTFTCLPLRPFNRLYSWQAVLDQFSQWHYQQVQSGWQWAGGAGDTKEGVSQRHSLGRDGWVELVTSVSDCHWGLVREYGGIMCLTS